MTITRVTKIRAHRVFRDFVWPSGLHAFGQFNLIYGWNGCGKTTLSSLFALLENRIEIGEGDVEFEIGERSVKAADIPSAVLPTVRVFNRDFVAGTVFASGGEIAPIYYVGRENVEKQRQVEQLKDDLSRAETEVEAARSEEISAEKALDDFSIAQAKIIKELLIGSRTTSYNNYDKRRFQQAIEELDATTQQAALLSDSDKANLRSQKDAQPKVPLSAVSCHVPDFSALSISTANLLERSVVLQVIAELASDRQVGGWVQQGLELHTGDRSTNQCRFCGQQLSQTRREALEAHFNEAFSRFQSEVSTLAAQVEQHKKRLKDLQIGEPSRLYDHLASDLETALATTRGLLKQAAGYLESLHSHLVAKGEAPFQPSSLSAGQPAPDREALVQAIAAINEVIERHNSITEHFQSEVDDACQELERCYVAEAFEDFTQLRQATATANSSVTTANVKAKVLRDQIGTVEREIVEHRRPAEELNAELHAYLGRDELRFEVREAGYAMTRDGQPASDLSEGEKTAIAFLYFLKSLQDKSFDLANGVVVIDDPVSSLDANALFSAFGYMKERTKECGQLFVLTHNFGFFRQVKNWFHHLPKQKSRNAERRLGRFFLMHTCQNGNGTRTAALGPLDPLLEEYESEYHYLFRRVWDEAQVGNRSSALEHHYDMPNIARRLLETFLAFRYPECRGGNALFQACDRIEFDRAKKTRILRFLNTYSHSGAIAEPEHDPSVLAETGPVLSDMLAMIKTVDQTHYEGMVQLVGPRETTP